MISLEYLDDKDFARIVEWNFNKSSEFLMQWAGKGYDYPLTVDNIKARFINEQVNRENSNTYIYKIILDETLEIIGTVELFNINRNEKTAVVGRFLIEEISRGKGYGKQALEKLVEMAFGEFQLEKLKLRVFDFNKGAIKCYENVGFTKNEFTKWEYEKDKWWGSYIMSINKALSETIVNKT